MKVSVVMASFNGEKYIQRQLDSILCQLKSEDELLISDDGSKDKTMQIVKQYQERYSVIRTVEGPRRGVVNNFNNAIRQAKNDVIFLCDQDDVWMPDKIEIVKKCFEHNKNRKVIMHDAVLCDENEKIFSKESIFEKRNAKMVF
jgi:glycosyltransferase involved in cell wall biosynthesis